MNVPDESMQSGNRAEYDYIVPKKSAQPQDYTRVHDWASVTQTELTGILAVTKFLLNQVSGVIFCDSQGAFQALNTLGKDAGNIASGVRMSVYRGTE